MQILVIPKEKVNNNILNPHVHSFIQIDGYDSIITLEEYMKSCSIWEKKPHFKKTIETCVPGGIAEGYSQLPFALLLPFACLPCAWQPGEREKR